MQPADSTVKAIDSMFFEHPRDIGESYGEHAGHAIAIGVRLLLTGLACLVHAILPGLFVRTASNTVDHIIALMEQRKHRATQSPATMMENPSN